MFIYPIQTFKTNMMRTNLPNPKEKRGMSNKKVCINNKSSSENNPIIKDEEEKTEIYHRLSQFYCSELFTIIENCKIECKEIKVATSCSYKRKLAYLVFLMEEIKHYNHPQLNQWLEIEKLEMILDLPEIADREWSKESPVYQRIFLDFLNIHTSVYEKAIRLLNEKNY